ncbi:hypothetical protein Bca52824_054046 [Brassica carinata]|uniref:DUF4283 domain-containing protein n=2 Tax=Brassica TaxID=3705 RepID=A0A8X7UMC1_BRACI|nr:hypothetical protein Bca52824_054046 [Brassica carinata]
MIGREGEAIPGNSLTGKNGENTEGRNGGNQAERARSGRWSKNLAGKGVAEPFIEIVDGIASLQIPDAIFDEAELLWKSFVVGYFIGDAPHVGSIHATVNRIWTGHKAGTKIDVQFIAKNTVLFRIENDQMRNRVIQRKYWHIADIPLVVNVWSPESAQNPPDLSAMPLWVDLRGVPNTLYSNKGLKCLVRAVGNFVKLHPNTEKCVRLDMARILVEVDLHKTLVEKITFADQAGASHEVLVNYPWLPPRCNVCCKWGHKGQDCSSKEIKILSKRTGETAYTSMPREGIAVGGGKGKEVEVSNVKGLNDDKISGGEETGIVEAVETRQKEGNPMEHLIKDLEELSPVASLDEKEAIKISETTKELSKTIDVYDFFLCMEHAWVQSTTQTSSPRIMVTGGKAFLWLPS